MSKKTTKFNVLKLTSFFILTTFLCLTACGKFISPPKDANRPVQAEDKRKRNIEEGRGVTLGNVLKNRGNTNYEFSTSNPMWRASLETLDFLPLTTVDYSGGIIITDWYADSSSSSNDAIKISIRFLNNEILSESLKVIVHKKTCLSNQNCKVTLLSKTKIKDELHSAIIRKAAKLDKEAKEKKKK